MGLFGRKAAEARDSDAGATITLEDGQNLAVQKVVDCLGDSCPRPQLMTKKALGSAASGEVIEVKIDNPTSLETVVSMIPEFGGTHLGTLKGKRGWSVVVRKI